MNALDKLKTALADRYTFEREIGEGGMATVYLARDIRHGRNVAVKVLKPELGAVLGAERFLSEISVTANLQHPNLLPLFDSGEADGLLYYVMPYMPGESLRARLDREKQLPIDDAVKISVAIAGALSYAHDHGVIHRDLKPENILLQAGQPVIADFGIALAVSNAGGARVTQTGLSLGTPQYMSPEQATGDREIDARSDIYSLGAVTYELIAGEAPHTGTSAQAIIAKLMTTEPSPLRTLRSTVPINVACAVEKAMAKLPADRFARADEFANAIQDPAFRSASLKNGDAGGSSLELRRWKMASIAIATLALVAFAVAAWAVRRPGSPKQVTRFILALDSTETLTGSFGRIAVSPDGSNIVYTGGLQRELFVRQLNDLNATRLPGTADAVAPFFSPDGRQVGFLTNRFQLKIVSLTGGLPTLITDSLIARTGASWGVDGFIYTSNRLGDDIVRLAPAPGSKVDTVTFPDVGRGETAHRFPEMLPNGKAIIFTVSYGAKGGRDAIALQVPGKRSHTILFDGGEARYSPSGHLLYVTSNRTLMAVRFDASKLMTYGEPIPISEGMRSGFSDAVDLGVSPAGTLAFSVGPSKTNSELVWVARDGKSQSVDTTWRGQFGYPAISPDGSRVAIGVTGPTVDVWIKQLDHGPSHRLTFEGRLNNYPSWTPDGKALTYYSSRLETDIYNRLMTKPADGSAQAMVQLAKPGMDISESRWSPDGKWLIFRTGIRMRTAGDIYAIRPGVDSVPTPLVATKFAELSPDLSPDGKYLVYSSNETGRDEIYVVPFPNASSAKWPVSTSGGTEPRWSHHGNEIFYRDDASNMVSVPVKTSPTFSSGASTVLFPARPFVAYPPHRQYDVTPDDRRFLMIRPLTSPMPDRLVIVTNWFEELKNKEHM